MRAFLIVLPVAVFAAPASGRAVPLPSAEVDGVAAEADPAARAIGGTVHDASGAVVPGALVSLRTASGEEVRTTSDEAGRFFFASVPPGTLRVTATLAAFAPASLEVDGPQPGLRLVLEPRPLTERVIVQAPTLIVSRIASATRTDTLLRDVPQSVSLVTRDQIADQSMQGMGDVVRYVPGLGIAQGEGNRDTPIFRGMSSTADFYVDGVRDDVQYFRDLYNVERVEALKGPNGMIFGRGGVGGVINRVSRQASWTPASEAVLQLGSWADRRVTGDVGRAVHPKVALRVTGVYEASDSYRDDVGLERHGVNPTLALALGSKTMLRAGYEFFHDERTADRGIPSFRGRPLVTSAATFFGDPDSSASRMSANVFAGGLEHRFGVGLTLRNRTSYGEYDKFYENVFPGAVDAAGTGVAITGYNNGVKRRNLFSQTDLVAAGRTGRLQHTLLLGLELGRQESDNLRNTAYFTALSPNATSLIVPLTNPRPAVPATFRPSPSDANNHGVATVAAFYAQDQVVFSSRFHAILGLRYDGFDVDFTNNRTSGRFTSEDDLLSPRLGLLYKPRPTVSIYASYGHSYLPRAGEQLSSLSLTNRALDPEKFRNYEVGAKWDLTPGLALTAAAYRLDRGNVIVPDPGDATRSILVDAQRTKGVEVGLGGNLTPAWSIVGGYAYQDGQITRSLSATVPAGSTLAQLPRHSFSVWNRYNVSTRWGAGLGVIHRGQVFTSTDNAVVLPRFTRIDAAVFFAPTPKLRAQLNVENLFDVDYYAYANSNNNITPGSPRAVRAALTTRF